VLGLGRDYFLKNINMIDENSEKFIPQIRGFNEFMSDENLYNLCILYGEKARMWRQKFIGLLPEVYKRRLFEKKGFATNGVRLNFLIKIFRSASIFIENFPTLHSFSRSSNSLRSGSATSPLSLFLSLGKNYAG
jgi:hypothetical protein